VRSTATLFWVLCPDTLGDSYKKTKWHSYFVFWDKSVACQDNF
jgi:hypothetical protein